MFVRATVEVALTAYGWAELTSNYEAVNIIMTNIH